MLLHQILVNNCPVRNRRSIVYNNCKVGANKERKGFPAPKNPTMKAVIMVTAALVASGCKRCVTGVQVSLCVGVQAKGEQAKPTLVGRNLREPSRHESPRLPQAIYRPFLNQC
jgi:hypothetical protein